MTDKPYKPTTYSQLYHPPDENSGDNPRTRRRLSKAFGNAAATKSRFVGDFIEDRLGIDPPRYGVHGHVDWPKYLEALNWNDFRSVLSLMFHFFFLDNSHSNGVAAKEYASQIKQIFIETNAMLSLGNDLIIHPKIDKVFERERASLIRGMAGEDYEAAREYIETVDNELMKDPPDGARAIYQAFLAAENIFKQMFPKNNQLNSNKAQQELSKTLGQVYGGGTHEHQAASKQLAGFCKWIDGAHFYRHEKGEAKPSQPPEELYVLSISEGFAFVRWLVALRAKDRIPAA